MPVFIENTDIEDLLKPMTNICYRISEQFPSLQEEAIKFRSEPVQACQPEGLLYVKQREFACTHPDDDVIHVLGTEDATTCHIIVVRHKGSGVTCLAHCDGCSTKQGIEDMLATVMLLSDGKLSGRLELHIFGGFCDDRFQSQQLTKEILSEFHKQPLPISLMTACVSELNDVIKDGKHWPVIYGIGVNVKTGAIFPAKFLDKGPDLVIRSTKTFVGDKDMMNIYDYKSRELRIKPFNWEPWPSAPLLLEQPDEVIRHFLSTSPDVEPPDFVSNVRETLKYIIQNPKPTAQVFPDGHARTYRKNESAMWTRVI
ncbi:protein N-terminal asparagine amidohydrolase-like [Antedon mediterranea]|uniref:protein N-terminal asparagine amidohydrolase-like n=1 Tax=Antedon mediterranea TaxID=105859 RepID=UPI003AF67267